MRALTNEAVAGCGCDGAAARPRSSVTTRATASVVEDTDKLLGTVNALLPRVAPLADEVAFGEATALEGVPNESACNGEGDNRLFGSAACCSEGHRESN